MSNEVVTQTKETIDVVREMEDLTADLLRDIAKGSDDDLAKKRTWFSGAWATEVAQKSLKSLQGQIEIESLHPFLQDQWQVLIQRKIHNPKRPIDTGSLKDASKAELRSEGDEQVAARLSELPGDVYFDQACAKARDRAQVRAISLNTQLRTLKPPQAPVLDAATNDPDKHAKFAASREKFVEAKGLFESNLAGLKVALDKSEAAARQTIEAAEPKRLSENELVGLTADAHSLLVGRMRDRLDMQAQELLACFRGRREKEIEADYERAFDQPDKIKDMISDDVPAPIETIPRRYLAGKQHLEDQIINSVTLVMNSDGSLAYRYKRPGEGDAMTLLRKWLLRGKSKSTISPQDAKFEIVDNWKPSAPVSPSLNLGAWSAITRFFTGSRNEKKAPVAKVGSPPPQPETIEFLDWIALPTHRPSLPSKTITLSAGTDATGIREAFQAYLIAEETAVPEDFEAHKGAKTGAFEFQENEPAIAAFEGIELLVEWLNSGGDREISVHVGERGFLGIAIDLPETLPGLRDEATLMALLVVQLICRIVDAEPLGRNFPQPSEAHPQSQDGEENNGSNAREHLVASNSVLPVRVDSNKQAPEGKEIVAEASQ
ncbi:MAG: hypothetical protein ABJJ69_21545 [Paracoccaceae bacterium]